MILAAAYATYQDQIRSPLSIPEVGLTIEVQKGESLNRVLARLEAEDILDSTLVAKLYARFEDLATKIKPGEFALPAGTSLEGLFAILISNERVKHRITLIEGSTVKEALASIAAEPLLSHSSTPPSIDNLLEQLLPENTDLLSAVTHPEGLLYPDTYFFHKGDSDWSIVSRAYQRLLTVLEQEWASKDKKLPLNSAYEALILASIVERETGKPDERSEIAGVFVRRLEKGMRLQTDPTVIYGLGDRYQGNITRKHLREFTPYNTYRIPALPPSPIALAGREAIHAALHPKAGKTLYFVAKGDGSHVFSETIEEHNRAVRQYQLRRREDYRSTHQAQ